MIDRLLSIGAAFDWVTPFQQLVGEGSGNERIIRVPESDLQEVGAILERNNIVTYHSSIMRGYYVFSVSVNDYPTVRGLLDLD